MYERLDSQLALGDVVRVVVQVILNFTHVMASLSDGIARRKESFVIATKSVVLDDSLLAYIRDGPSPVAYQFYLVLLLLDPAHLVIDLVTRSFVYVLKIDRDAVFVPKVCLRKILGHPIAVNCIVEHLEEFLLDCEVMIRNCQHCYPVFELLLNRLRLLGQLLAFNLVW